MKAVFEPTGYVFKFDDNYFVQVVHDDGTEKTGACFSDLSDAVTFANAQVTRPAVKAAYVYSRTHQHHTARRPECLTSLPA